MTQDDSNNMANASVNADALGEQVQSEQTKREKAQQQVIAVVTILGGLSEMPEAVGKLNQDTRTAFSGMKEVKVREPKGLRGMFSVLNNFRKEDSLAPVLDTVGGITLMLNPFFIFVIFVALVVEFLLALSAFLIVLF